MTISWAVAQLWRLSRDTEKIRIEFSWYEWQSRWWSRRGDVEYLEEVKVEHPSLSELQREKAVEKASVTMQAFGRRPGESLSTKVGCSKMLVRSTPEEDR